MRLAFCLLLFFAQGAAAQEDVGLVGALAGEAAYQGGPVRAYMRVREGDRFELPAGARLTLIYFAGGRQERWEGPVRLAAGKGESTLLSGKPAVVATLPASVPQRLARVPELTRNALFGGVVVRGKPPAGSESDATLREARATYERMRRELPADDLTPELFLYAALASGPDPDSDEAKSLAARLRVR